MRVPGGKQPGRPSTGDAEACPGDVSAGAWKAAEGGGSTESGVGHRVVVTG